MAAHKGSKILKKVWAGALCAALVSILNITGATSSFANDRQVMNYDVYAGGFHVVSANLTVDVTKKNNYNLRLAAYTRGMLAKLAPWKGVFDTNGHFKSKIENARPSIHSSNTTWRDEHELVEFVYNKDGSFKEHRMFNEEQNGKQPPLPNLSKDSTDVLTSTLLIMDKIGRGGKCEGSDKIFDGARSYDLAFNEVGQETLKGNDMNVYSGPATKCTVEVRPLDGKWHEKPRGWMSIQEQGRERGTMPTIWLAKMTDGQPAVPVKILVKTEYGALFMHLTHYQAGDKKITLAKQ